MRQFSVNAFFHARRVPLMHGSLACLEYTQQFFVRRVVPLRLSVGNYLVSVIACDVDLKRHLVSLISSLNAPSLKRRHSIHS